MRKSGWGPYDFHLEGKGCCSQARKQHSYMNDTPSVRLTDDVK